MGAALAIGGQILGWIWDHKTLAALIGVAIFAAIQTSRLDTRTIQFNAAQSMIDASEKSRKLSEADAARWHAASDQRDAAIVGLNERINTQNAHVDALAAAKSKAEQFAIEAAAETARARSKAAILITQLEQRAHDHPEEARPLGPAACAAYRELYGETAACTHPGANPAP
jgi:hypothetical protein